MTKVDGIERTRPIVIVCQLHTIDGNVCRPSFNVFESSSGGWTRTITRLLNREPPYRLDHTGMFHKSQDGWI